MILSDENITQTLNHSKRLKKYHISFDSKARRNYLTTLSHKKKERRTFGLAMQAKKDRQKKIEKRKEKRKANCKKIQETERIIKLKREEKLEHKNLINNESSVETTKFTDENTTSIFGRTIVVKTTMIPSDTEENSLQIRKQSIGKDTEQEYAGSIKKYIYEIKKRKNSNRTPRKKLKGRHGAEQMRGMGSAVYFKAAKKTIDKFRLKRYGKHKWRTKK